VSIDWLKHIETLTCECDKRALNRDSQFNFVISCQSIDSPKVSKKSKKTKVAKTQKGETNDPCYEVSMTLADALLEDDFELRRKNISTSRPSAIDDDSNDDLEAEVFQAQKLRPRTRSQIK